MIRKFRMQDLDACMEIWFGANMQAHRFIEHSYWQNHFEQVRRQLPSADIYVYEENERIYGFIGCIDTYIAGLFVMSCHRGKGIGKQLLNQLKEHKQALSLHVYKENNRAVQFYEREGFSCTNENIDTDTGHAELTMSWQKA